VVDRAWFAVLRRVVPVPGALGGTLVTIAVLPVAAIAWAAYDKPYVPRALAIAVILASMTPATLAFAGGARAQRILEQLAAAQEREDVAEIRRLRRIIDGDHPPRNAFERAHRLLGDAEMLRACGRWEEAREAFALVELDALPEHARPGILAQRGLVMAYDGAPEMGLALIEAAIAASKQLEGYARGRSWCLRVRRATALSLAERHDEAADAFDEVFAEEAEDAEVWTEGMFSRGRSLHALGAVDDARFVIERSANEGSGRSARQAKIVLALVRAAPLDPEALGRALAAVDGSGGGRRV